MLDDLRSDSGRERKRVLAFMNQKGGCGKTTTAVHLAGALSALGERVLLVDLDPQAHATMALGCAVVDEPALVDVLLQRAEPARCIQRAGGGIDLLPGSAELAHFEESAERLFRPERRLHEALETLDEYDWVLLDCPPRMHGVLCANALSACREVVLVVETGAFALQGALQAIEILGEAVELHGLDVRLRVLATLFDRRTRFAREVLTAMHARFGRALLETVVRTSIRLREAAAVGQPIQAFAPNSKACADFAALAVELQRLAPDAPRSERSTRLEIPSRTGR